MSEIVGFQKTSKPEALILFHYTLHKILMQLSSYLIAIKFYKLPNYELLYYTKLIFKLCRLRVKGSEIRKSLF